MGMRIITRCSTAEVPLRALPHALRGVDENRDEKEDEDNKKNNRETKVEVRFTESRR